MSEPPRPKSLKEEDWAQVEAEAKAFAKGSVVPSVKSEFLRKAEKVPSSGPKGSSSLPSNPARIELMDEDEGEEEPLRGDHVPLDPSIEGVLKPKVTERVYDPQELQSFSVTKPTVPDVKLGSESGTVKKSLFAQGLRSKSKPKGKSIYAHMFDAAQNKEQVEEESKKMEAGGPDIVGDKLHPYLAGMTETEILEEQKKLVEKLDPNLIEFIKTRYKKKPAEESVTSGTSTNREPAKTDEDVEMTPMPQPLPVPADTNAVVDQPIMEDSDLPINPASVKGIPHMAEVEYDKLQWTGIVKEGREKHSKLEEGQSARFDFDGALLAGEDIDTVKTFEKGLHHHGEEMEKPGYTIEELLTLSQSANKQQKARALQIIGNIYGKAHTGMYDLVLGKDLFELWEHMDFVYTIRKGVDEIDRTLVNEAIHCLANILYPMEEEFCLDLVSGWEHAQPHPWISTMRENLKDMLDPGEEEKELTDPELLRLDVVEFFVHRSNLLDRFAYTLKCGCLTEMGVDGMLKILVRVARHSPNLLCNHEILDLVVQYYTHPKWNHVVGSGDANLRGVPLYLAFKIVRILIDSNSVNALKIYESLNFFPSVLAYIAYDDWSSTSVHRPENIVIECFKIWIALLGYGIAVDEYSNFFPKLMKFLIIYPSLDFVSNFDAIHSGYVFTLLNSILTLSNGNSKNHSHWPLVKDCVTSVELFLCKLLSVAVSSEVNESKKDAIYWSISRGLCFLNECRKYDPLPGAKKVISGIERFLKSPEYVAVTSKLRSASVILQAKHLQESRYLSSFGSVDAIPYGGECNPIIKIGNSLPFLSSLFNALNVWKDQFGACPSINSHVREYISAIVNSNSTSQEANFFVRFELSLILQLLHLCDPEEKFYLAYKALSETPNCCAKLFNSLLRIALSSCCEGNDEEICNKIYGDYLKLSETGNEIPTHQSHSTAQSDVSSTIPTKKVRFACEDNKSSTEPSTILFQRWSERAIESTWILEPLHRIRTIACANSEFLSKHRDEIEVQCRVCLQLISKCLEQYKEFLLHSRKRFMEFYCSICQVFLIGEPQVYMNSATSEALQQILRNMVSCSGVRKWKELPIFSTQRKSVGLPNMFFDLYPELLVEYSANSYFNTVFANYLLIPLRTPEAPRLKSNFWIMETLNHLRLTSDQVLLPVEYLTSGIEQDPALLDIYVRTIRSGRITESRNPFLFKVVKTILTNAINNLNPTTEDDRISQLKKAFENLNM